MKDQSTDLLLLKKKNISIFIQVHIRIVLTLGL